LIDPDIEQSDFQLLSPLKHSLSDHHDTVFTRMQDKVFFP